MVRANRSIDELAKVAQLYYLDDLSQQEIAERLGTTRSNVSRMLKAAKQAGLVEIRVVHPTQRDRELEAALKRRFRLHEARVAPFDPAAGAGAGAGAGHGQQPLTHVGKLAAGWLDEVLRDGMVLGLSWGISLQAMVDEVVPERRHAIELRQLVGGLSALQAGASGHELIRGLAERLGADYAYLHAPALFESQAACRTLLEEPSTRDYLERARQVDVALVGIGARGVGSSAAIVEALNLSPAERAELEASGFVGDVCARYFDLNGQEVRSAARNRVLAVSLEDLRRIPTVVGVLAGREKALGTLGALRGQMLDVLVCDEAAARSILEFDGATPPGA